MAELAIHIVTWNGAKYLPALLSSLELLSNKDKVIFRILDNGSNDETVAILNNWSKQHGAWLLTLTENIGFSGGHNRLFNEATEKYIALVNQDMVLEADYFTTIVDKLESDDKIGSASGVLFRMSNGEKKSVIDTAGLGIARYHSVFDRHELPAQICKAVFGVSAACSVYRVSALNAVAYRSDNKTSMFSEYFHSYKEDVDLAYRLQLAGWDSVVLTNAIAWHERGIRIEESRHSAIRPYVLSYQSYRNHLLFLLHTASYNLMSWTAVTVAVYELIKMAWLLVREPKVLKAWKDIWAWRSDILIKRQSIRQGNFMPNRIVQWYGK